MKEFESDKDNCFATKRGVSADRRKKNNRRGTVDRRLGLDRRRGPGKRLSDDRKAAEEGNMTDEQFEFLMAVDDYKKLNNKPFPTWTEVLELVKALGYRKVAEPSCLDESTKKQASMV